MSDDKDLVQGLQQGDGDSLREAYERYKDDLLTVARCLLAQPMAAEDVLHDVFVGLASSNGRLRVRHSLRAYLATSVANRARDQLRRRKVEPGCLIPGDDPVAPTAEPAAEALDGEESQRLYRALGELPYEQREVISLHLHGGLTFREIAREQGVSSNTVQSRYRYGLDKLRSVLGAGVGI